MVLTLWIKVAIFYALDLRDNPSGLFSPAMSPMKAEEILRHPHFGRTTLHLEARMKGKIDVAKDRNGPVHIAYEVHGNGPRHLIFIIGLGTFKIGWQRQVQYFGHEQGSNYTCLIYDNRGMGESDKPLARYSTSEMAKDTLALVNHLAWTSPRQLHVLGVSLGGMIAQELGYWENLSDRINMDTKGRTFSQSWLEAPDEYGEFPTNGDRFAAMDLAKRQDLKGFTRKGIFCQAIAAGWHHKNPEQLSQLADKVGRQRIQVLHGTADRMISPPHGETLARELGGEEKRVTKIIVEGRGHVLHNEERAMYQEVLESMVEKAEKLE
ncbi:MAG: hypothetical protein Q9173_001328 [Seirophora scorigena]